MRLYKESLMIFNQINFITEKSQDFTFIKNGSFLN